jgi:hypothetical protein
MEINTIMLKTPGSARKASLALITLLIALTSWHAWIRWKSADQAAETMVSTLARTLEFQADTTFRSIDNLLLEASQRIDPERWPDPQLAGWFQSRLAAFPETMNLVVVKPDGMSAGPGLSANGMVGQPIDVSDRQYFRTHRAHQTDGRMLIGDPVTSRLDGRQNIPLSRSILGPDGVFKGMVGLSLDPRFLVEALETLKVEEKGGISIIRRDGVFLARLPDQYGSFGRSVAASPLFSKFIPAAPSGIARFVSVSDGNAKIVAYRTLERYPLVVSVGITERTAFAQFRTEIIALAVVVLLLSIALYWLAAVSDRREHARALLAARLEE